MRRGGAFAGGVLLLLLGCFGRALNLSIRPFLTAVDRLRTEPEEYGDAVSGRAGDLSWCHAELEGGPQRRSDRIQAATPPEPCRTARLPHAESPSAAPTRRVRPHSPAPAGNRGRMLVVLTLSVAGAAGPRGFTRLPGLGPASPRPEDQSGTTPGRPQAKAAPAGRVPRRTLSRVRAVRAPRTQREVPTAVGPFLPAGRENGQGLAAVASRVPMWPGTGASSTRTSTSRNPARVRKRAHTSGR